MRHRRSGGTTVGPVSTLSSDLRTLSREAYIYLYPLVVMNISRLQQTSPRAGSRPGFGPPNQFHHFREFPGANFRAVVRPNFDTLYSSAWLDLSAGPAVLHAPDTGDRYYMLPLLDMWTDVFANPGKRTTGTEARDFVIAGPGYAGALPAGMPVIAAPTPYVWVIGRTQTNGPGDYPAVHAVQDGYTVTPLAGAPPHVTEPRVDVNTEPLRLAERMNATEFFGYAAQTLKVNPPHATDFSVLARIARLGLVPGQDFDPDRFDSRQRAELEDGAAAAKKAMQTAMPMLGTRVNGWTMITETMGVYGNNYLKRAVVAFAGLGANPAEDAIYPVLTADADGSPLSGGQDYVLHFDAGELPPAAAFWSVTMYDAEGYQAANELNRFALGDRDPLTYNPDGSLDLYLQHANPGPEREANWLPAPRGPLGVTMRLYAPRPAALDGRWSPPPARKA